MGEFVQELLCGCRQFKAVVEARSDGRLQVTTYKWQHEVVQGLGEVCEPFWAPMSRGLTLTDSVDSALTIALEKLQLHCPILAPSAAQRVCKRFGSDYEPPHTELKCGLALSTLDGRQPLNALRHPPEPSTSGWFIWAGEELSDAHDFFQPLHLKHLVSHCPAIIPYLALQPGYRVLLAPTQEEVWYDESLLSS